MKDSSASGLFREWSQNGSGMEESETERQSVKGVSSSQSPLGQEQLHPVGDL